MLRLSAPVLLLLGAALLGAAACQPFGTRSVSAPLLRVQGGVLLQPATRPGGIPASPTLTVGPGDVVITERDGHADLQLIPNAVVSLESDSALEISRLLLSKEGNATGDAMRRREARVKLSHGSLFALHERRDQAVPELIIETPQGLAVATTDCFFHLETNASAVRIVCLRGTIAFRPAGASGEKLVGIGFVDEWSAAGARQVPVEEDEAAPQFIAENTGTEKKLRILRNATRDCLPFR